MESFQQQALCFSMPPEDFDPNQVPTDGEQYLQSVIYERTKCPAVVVKPLVRDEQKTVQSVWDQYEKSETDLNERTPFSLLPTSEWLQMQSTAFENLHDRITKLRENFTHGESNLPDDQTETAWLDYCQQHEPLLLNMLHIHQRDLEELIEFQSNWLTDDIDWYLANKDWYPQWVYCSLACLRLPCEPNLLNSLRKIARTCHRLRNQLNANESATIDNATPLSLLICIVSRNFDQSDLVGQTKS